MLGKNQIVIDKTNFMAGMSSSDFAGDAGFSPGSYGVNPKSVPGVLFGTPGLTDTSTNVVGTIFASCQGIPTNVRAFLDSSANFYTMASSGYVMTKSHAGSKTYSRGFSDMVLFAGYIFASSTVDVTKWDGASSFTETWFSGLSGSPGGFSGYNPHPMLVYQGNMYIADGNLLYEINSSLAFTSNGNPCLELQTDECITALGIDPSTGLMLVVTQSKQVDTAYDVSQVETTPSSIVYFYDGIDTSTTRSIPVNDGITALLNVGGTVFALAGQRLYYWSGTGIEYLRTLQYSTLGTLWKNSMANIGSVLYVIDGDYILAYGEPQASQQSLFPSPKKAWYVQKMGSAITALAPIGGNLLAVCYGTESIGYFDTSATAAVQNFVSNRIEFPRPVFIRRIRVFTTGITTSTGAGGFSLINENDATISIAAQPFIVLAANTPQYKFDFDFGGLKLQLLQIFINFAQAGVGLYRVIVYYDGNG